MWKTYITIGCEVWQGNKWKHFRFTARETPHNRNVILGLAKKLGAYEAYAKELRHMGYRIAVCRVVSKLGNILSAGRRKNWLLMKYYETNPRGLYIHTKLKDLLLYGRTFKGTLHCHTNNKEYEI